MEGFSEGHRIHDGRAGQSIRILERTVIQGLESPATNESRDTGGLPQGKRGALIFLNKTTTLIFLNKNPA